MSILSHLRPATLSKHLSHALPFIQPDINPKQLTDFYKGHVAAITGAGSGIGRQLAINLAEAGCHLALADINADNLQQTVALIKDNQIKITTTTVDVSDKEAVYAWADEVKREHGKVNFIFNNAGVSLSSSAEGVSIEELEWVMNINFWGVVYGTKAFLPLIKQSVKDSKQSGTRPEHGHIINISSLFGLIAQPTQSAYNASKFAVRGFNESLRQELAMQKSDVSITSVHPGGIRTNIAVNARVSDSLSTLGLPTGEKAIKSVSRLLRFDPNTAAQIILMAAANNRPRCLIGDDAKVADLIQRLFPSHYNDVMVKANKLTKRKRKKQRAKRSQ